MFFASLSCLTLLCSAPGESARDAIIAAFDSHPIVALGELHGNVEVHALLRDLVRDERFLERVDDIVVEFACATQQDLLDRYIGGEDVSIEALRHVWRDTGVSPQMTWDAPVYARFFAAVRDANLSSAASGSEARLRVLAGDPPIDWSATTTSEQLFAFFNDPDLERDVHFAGVVEREVLAKGRRALLVSGGGHLTRRNLWVFPAPNPSPDTTTVHLLRDYPESVFVILTLGARALSNAEVASRLSTLDVPAVLSLSDRWFGRRPASDFAGVRRYNVEGPGKWPFEGLVLADTADAVLFVGRSLTDSLPPFDYQDEAYRTELNRRRRLLGAPERTRVDQGIVEIGELIDAGRFDDAFEAIELISRWGSESPSLDDRLMELHGRIEELGG